MTMWTTGLHLLDVGLADEDRTPKRLEYLRTMMLRNPENVSIVLFLLFSSRDLICSAGRYHQRTGPSFDSRR